MAFFSLSLNVLYFEIKPFSLLDKYTGPSCSAKNSDKEIPNASHMSSNVSIVGQVFLCLSRR